MDIQFSRRYWLNLITTFLSQAFSAAIIVVLTPVLQQHFSTEEFSNYGVLLNVVTFAAAFDFGMNIGLMRRLIHEQEKASELISTVFFLYLFLFLGLFPLFAVLYKANIINIGSSFLKFGFLTALLVAQTILSYLFDVILNSANKIFLAKLIRIGKVLAELILLWVCSKWGSAGLMLLTSAGINLFYILVLYGYSRKEINYTISWNHFSLKILIDHFRYSFWYFLNAVSVVLAFNAQIILLNGVGTKKEVAVFFLVSRFMDVVRIGATNFTTILFPSLASLEAKGQWDTLKTNYFSILKRVILFSIIALFLLLTVGKYIFSWWSHQNSNTVKNLFTVSSLFTIMIIIDNVSSVFLNAFRLNRGQTILSVGQGMLALFLGYFLWQYYGLIGIALGSLTALLCTNFLYNPLFLISQFKKKTSPPSL